MAKSVTVSVAPLQMLWPRLRAAHLRVKDVALRVQQPFGFDDALPV